jgi:ATP-dependent DNA helicase RecQ
MQQFQAGYILESVSKELKKLSTDETIAQVNGLLQSLSTFDVQTNVNLEPPDVKNPLLSVSHNIITRGLPTFPSEYIEEQFAGRLGFTTSEHNFGTISYPLKKTFQTREFCAALFESLHIVDPRYKSPSQFLNVEDSDSNFEKSFLLQFIPSEKNYLTQLFQHQRRRQTLGAPIRNQGRVDFCFEIPYAIAASRQNSFNQQVWIKYKRNYIVEIDGSRYHTDLVDDLKDFEIGQLGNRIQHIREDDVDRNLNDFLTRICKEEYISVVEKNFKKDLSTVRDTLCLTLSPIAIARFQRILIQYLLSNIDQLNAKNVAEIKIAVVERDVPFAFLGLIDLEMLLANLFSLAGIDNNIPKISIEVFSTKEFIGSPLHLGKEPKDISLLNSKGFDLTIDVSMLWRSAIFKIDSRADLNSVILVRSSHFVHPQTVNEVMSAPLIKYQMVTRALPNEQHEIIPEVANNLRYFLRTIFRKTDFRDGQLPILNRAIQLRSVIGLLPTGGGKSLTYQLASMLQPGITVVVDPIRSLMLDQYNGLKRIGIDKCEFINSTLSTAERSYNQKTLLTKGRLQFVFISPERFVIEEFRKALKEANSNGFYFAYAVIDEVHCVSEWGHDFRTPYLNLGSNAMEFCKTLSGDLISLFGLTATASFDVLADIERELNIPGDDGNAIVRYENTVRDEINYSIREVIGDFTNTPRLDQFSIRETVGNAKAKEAFSIVRNIERELNLFNDKEVLSDILTKTYQDYLPDLGKPDQESFVSKSSEILMLPSGALNFSSEEKLFKYGTIVFCPHRNGALGVKTVHESSQRELLDERSGYFMGSGEDQDSERIDQESFKHLEDFVSSRESMMIATKAFGMGIDKPNVRMTIHMNIPQSIESFVQEAGRAGRDKRISKSIILYNKQIFDLSAKPFHLDKDVLMYFHKISFKGEIKERQVIHELRTKITFPNSTRLNQFQELINDLYPTDEGFVLQLGRNNWENFLFVKTGNDTSVGSLNILTKNLVVRDEYGNPELAHEILNAISGYIPFPELASVLQVRNWLQSLVSHTTNEVGIETTLVNMAIGDQRKIQIPFTNKYYSKPKRAKAEFVLNPEHGQFVMSVPVIQELTKNGAIPVNLVSTKLKDAVYGGLDYSEFLDSLGLTNAETVNRLKADLALQRAFYIPRSQSDTAKAIYRLISIGIIDSYTIDYQNNLYTVLFTKKEDEDYFDSLRTLFERYTSQKTAKAKIQDVKDDFEVQSRTNRATVISICLKHLTDFVYSKIADKRLQAINDMIALCETAIQIENPIRQSAEVKDEIYYYFNAKYSRFGNDAIVNGISVPASMPDDREQIGDFNDLIEKYLDLSENDQTGEFKNNIKHLRGSAMRMLRSFPDEPHYLILKSYSLFILSDTIASLLEEGKNELIKGLISWKRVDEAFNVETFVTFFKTRINRHVDNELIDAMFDLVEDEFYSSYYSQWLKKFNDQFITSN